VTVPGGGVIAYTRDGAGLPLRVDYPNGAYIANAYDGAGRLTEVANGNGAGVFARYVYTLDGLGNRTREVQTLVEDGMATVLITTYTYDARQELIVSAASDRTVHCYDFDPAGNRTRMWGVRHGASGLEAYSVNYAYNAADQLLSADDSVLGLSTYTYDANGARSSQQEPGRRVAYGYDGEDRLTAAIVQVPDGQGGWALLDGRSERYAYDGLGRRVRKEQVEALAGARLWARAYLYGADWPVLTERTDEGGSPAVTRYLYDDGLNRLWAAVDGGPGYFHTDGLGSVVGYTDGSGNLVSGNGLRDYGDYGAVRGGGEWFSDSAYTGHEREAYTGLYYARHRYYDSEAGVWLTLDSERGQSKNPLSRHRYSYVMNNPVSYSDVLGLYPTIGEIARSAYEQRGVDASYVVYEGQTIDVQRGHCLGFVQTLYNAYNAFRLAEKQTKIDVGFLSAGSIPTIATEVLKPGSRYCEDIVWKQGEPSLFSALLKPGDILIDGSRWPGHIAVYIGDGEIAQTSSDPDPKGPGLQISEVGEPNKALR
jgi:RHS repeat-associated protein